MIMLPYMLDQLFKELTSSFVSLGVSLFGLGRRANLGALTFENARVLSCGGPPLGWPLITTASPDNTYQHTHTTGIIYCYT